MYCFNQVGILSPLHLETIFGSGELPGKMLLVRIIENNKIDAYLGQVRLSKG